ncbi:hypothetical protein PG993_011164 [Apiospora rasikravindrae]|uniref:Uncharacterized protein n=1 Tax=Apiospora rasikravindrae TaxID=990691 RepID=A0ABR1SDF8_9PEZI
MYFVQSLFKTALLASLAFNALACPIDRELTQVVVQPTTTLPTVAECRAQLKAGNTLFYSGPGGYQQLAEEAISSRPYPHDYQILVQKWKDPSWPNPWVGGPDPKVVSGFFDVCSEALAQMATGTAYVLLPKLGPGEKGTDWFTGSVWARIERPNVPAGVKMIRVIPDDVDWKETIKG